MLWEKGSCRAEATVNVGCLNVTKLSFEVWLLFKLQSSGDSPGPQKIILRKYTGITLLKKQGAAGGAGAQPQTASTDKSPTVTQQHSVGVGQRLRPGSLGVCSSLMGNFTALTSFTLLTGLFAKQLLIYKGCNILHRMFWCGPQQSCSWQGACLGWAGGL